MFFPIYLAYLDCRP